MKFLLFLAFFNYAHAMNISEIKEIPITEEIQSNIRLDSGSKLYLNQLAFKNDQSNTTQTANFNLKLECRAQRKKSITNCKLVHLEQADPRN